MNSILVSPGVFLLLIIVERISQLTYQVGTKQMYLLSLTASIITTI